MNPKDPPNIKKNQNKITNHGPDHESLLGLHFELRNFGGEDAPLTGPSGLFLRGVD